MSDLVLYSYRRCPFAIRVRMTLEEKGLKYKTIEEDLSNLSRELLDLHPEGRVPLLVHGDLVLYESSIITEYLEEKFPTPALMPPSSEGRAQVRLWTYWCNSIFKPDLDAFKYEKDAAAGVRLLAHLERIEKALRAHAFLLGDALTLADVHLFPFYRQLKRVAPPLAGIERFTLLDAWLERITARPSFERTMSKPAHDFLFNSKN